MLTLLDRNVAAIDSRLTLLAPPSGVVPSHFQRVQADPAEHSRLIREMQHLRGAVYLDDGAVAPSQLSPDGLHQTPEDLRSWHLLMRGADGRINACAWYMQHEQAMSVHELRARRCPLGQDVRTRGHFVHAVESELERARAEGLRYAEVGGWAVAKQSRCTAEGILLALAAYSLGRAMGGAIGLTTATVRHSSSTILRRLGGSHLRAGECVIGPYFDPHYGCEMELLRFDSRQPSRKYTTLIDRIQMRLAKVIVVTADEAFEAAGLGTGRAVCAA
jgi:hypothetical protein